MKKRLIVLSNVLVMIVGFGTSSIQAQYYRTFVEELEHIGRTAKWKVGPFRLASLFQIREVGYDNNLYYSQMDPISDYTLTVSPRFEVYYPARGWFIFSLAEYPEYVYYFQEKTERSLNNQFSPGLRLFIFNRFALSGHYRYQRTKTRSTSEFYFRVYETRQSYKGSFFLETKRRSALGFSGAIEKIRYDDVTLPGEETPIYQDLNRQEKNGTLEFYYGILGDSIFFITAGYSEYIFEYTESRWRDSFSYQAFSGARFPLFGRMRGVLSLGYKKLSPKYGGRGEFSGLVGNTNIDLRVGRFAWRVQFIKDVNFSYDDNNVFYLEDRYMGGLSFYLSQRLRLDYDFIYAGESYPEPVQISLPDGSQVMINRRDTFRVQTVGIVFRITGATGIGIASHWWDRRSNDPIGTRSRWFVGGYITYEF
jgi:hypothetical protein